MTKPYRTLKRSIAALATIIVALPVLAVITVSIVGCAAISPSEVSTSERLDSFPVQAAEVSQPVEIFWDKHQTPYIYAQTDADLAFAMGMVTQHLRGAQLAIMKRVAYGRLGESAGPFSHDVDHLLHLLDFPKAGALAEAALDDQTRAWVESYVRGLNAYQNHWSDTPPEFGLLGLEAEPWTVSDIMTIGRMASADVTWLAYLNLLEAQQTPEWETIKDRMMQRDIGVGASRDTNDAAGSQFAMAALLDNFNKTGSNTVAIGATRSATGAPMIANDPHLGLGMPNFWLTIGIQSPSYHAVGFMVPGLPFLALGRNEHIAWGGTNARSASSWLVDVTNEPIDCTAAELTSRFWFNSDVEVCTSAYGPVITDHPMWQAPDGKRYALNWLGHRQADEGTSGGELAAFLRSNRARNVQEFRQAFAGYAVSSQNLIAVDKQGGLVHVLAMTSPTDLGTDLVQHPSNNPQNFLDGTQLPADFAQQSEVITSANNRPHFAPSWQRGFYSSNSRADRLRERVVAQPKWSVQELLMLQQDTYSAAAHGIAKQLADYLLQHSQAEVKAYGQELVAWDGHYQVESTGALAFEQLLAALTPQLYANADGAVPKAFENWEYLSVYLVDDLRNSPDANAVAAASVATANETRQAFGVWGDMHRLRAGHWFAAAPVIGSLFVEQEWSAPGSRDTVLKRAHNVGSDLHYAFYGAQSRHISDMSDLDENYFVLFGGSDGWMGSENYADQASMMVEGEMIKVPLRLQSARENAVYSTRLVPAATSKEMNE